MDKMWAIRIAALEIDFGHLGSFLVAIVKAESEGKARERFQELKLEFPVAGDPRPPQLLDTEQKVEEAHRELKENIKLMYNQMGYWAKKWNILRANRDAFKRGG